MSFEDGTLTAQQAGGRPFTLVPVAKDEFVYDQAFSRLKFRMAPSGEIESLDFIARGQPTQTGRRVGDAPAPRKAITLAAHDLDRLLGVYELEPGFRFTVTRDGTQLFLQATGQGRAEAFAESKTKFFFRVVDAQIEFTIGEDGRASVLTLHQGGAATPAKRVKQGG